MAFTVRSLLPKVQIFRNDLEKEKAIFAIQECVRKICRQTEFAQTTVQAYGTLGNPLLDLTTSMATYGTVYRVSKVRVFDPNMVNNNVIKTSVTLVPSTSYKILTVGTSDFTLSGALNNYVGTSFTATATSAGTGTVAPDADNALLGCYMTLSEGNQVRIDNGVAYVNYPTGFPAGWTYIGNNTLEIYPTPVAQYNFEVTASYIPTTEIDTIPLPLEAEEAIIAGALANLLMQPGSGQNIQLAKDREVLHNREMDFLKASALLGQSGRPRAMGPSFVGRVKQLYATRWY